MKKQPVSDARTGFFLTRFNRMFWHLLITPLFTLLYVPVNRYVMLPLFGSGRPYTDGNGQIIETYFSANSAALLLFYGLQILTLLFSVRRMRTLAGGCAAKIGFLIFCLAVSLFTGIAFLEFSVWA